MKRLYRNPLAIALGLIAVLVCFSSAQAGVHVGVGAAPVASCSAPAQAAYVPAVPAAPTYVQTPSQTVTVPGPTVQLPDQTYTIPGQTVAYEQPAAAPVMAAPVQAAPYCAAAAPACAPALACAPVDKERTYRETLRSRLRNRPKHLLRLRSREAVCAPAATLAAYPVAAPAYAVPAAAPVGCCDEGLTE